MAASTYDGIWGPGLGGESPNGRGYEYAAPLVYASSEGHSALHIQNAGSSCATVTVWVTPDGLCESGGSGEMCAVTAVAPGEATVVDAAQCLPAGSAGVARISGTGPLAVEVDTWGPTTLSSYTGTPLRTVTQHDRPVLSPTDGVGYAPLVYKDYAGRSSRLHVQNTGPITSVLEVSFLDRSGDAVSVRQFGPLCPQGSLVIDLDQVGGIPYCFIGSARIESLPDTNAPVATPWLGPEPTSTPRSGAVCPPPPRVPTPGTPPSPTVTRTATVTATPRSTDTVRPQPTGTSTVGPAPSTSVPTPTQVGAPTATPSPLVCDFIANRVPAVAIIWALANPRRVSGWGQLAYPSLPPSPFNQPRTTLSLQNIGAPYHPLYNSLVYKAGCP